MTLSKLGCWLRGKCKSPWTWVGAAGLATVQAFTGAVGAAAGWALAHAGGLLAGLSVTGNVIAPSVGWLPSSGWGPLILGAGLLFVGSLLWRWTGGTA